MKLLTPLFILFSCVVLAQNQKHTYNVELFGKSIGTTTVERIDKGDGVVQYKLNSTSEVNILLSHKTSQMVFDVNYKDGKMFSSYVKNVKDGVTEIVTIAWNGTKYIIKKGEETLQFPHALDFSSIQLYFYEPKGKTSIFSERLGEFCNFIKLAEGVYQCKLPNGVTNIYRYRNGILYELEMSKGASVFMKLVN